MFVSYLNATNRNMDKRFFNAKELATYLGLSEETIRKRAQRGTIPFSKFGKSLRFDIRKIDTWIKQKECYYNKQIV